MTQHTCRRLKLEQLETRQLLTIGLDPTFGISGVVVGSEPIEFDATEQAVTSVVQQDKMILASKIFTGKVYTALSRYDVNGSLDTSFGNGGVTYLTFDTGDEKLQDLIVAPDGSLMALISNNHRATVLAKLHPNGELDTNFGKSGFVYLEDGLLLPRSIAFDAHGSLYISQVYSGTHVQLSKYSAAGVSDRSFAGVGYLRIPVDIPVPELHNLLVLDDGSVLLPYSSRTDTPNYRLYVHRVNSDGTLDDKFGSNGQFTWDLSNDARYGQVGSVKLLFDGLGNTLATGTKRTDVSQDFFAVKFNTEGKVVSDYGVNGVVIIKTGGEWGTVLQDADLLQDGSLMLTGTIGFLFNPIAVTVNADGSSSVMGNRIATIKSSQSTSTASRVGSRILAAYSNTPTQNIDIVAFKPDGNIDESFGASGIVHINQGRTWDRSSGGDILELQDGKLLSVSTFDLPYGLVHPRDLVLVRRLADGSVDTSYGTNGSLVLPKDWFPTPESHFLKSGDDIYFFSATGNVINIYKLTMGGEIDPSFGSQGRLDIPRSRLQGLYSVTATSDGFLLIGEGRDADYGNYVVLKFDRQGIPVATFGNGGGISVPHQLFTSVLASDLVLTSDGGFLAQFRSTDSFSTQQIMKFDSNGQLDTRFAKQGIIRGYWPIQSQLVSVDSGAFYLVSGEVRRFLPNGDVDLQFGWNGTLTFDLPSDWTAPQTKAVKVDDLGNILVAFDIEAGHDRDTLLMRFNQSGKLDSNFGVAGYLLTNLSQYDDALNEISFASTGAIYFSGSRITNQYRQSVFGRIGEDGKPSLPWYNSQVPTDVNKDGFCSPIDAMLIINYLNRFGSQPVPDEWPELGWLDVSADNSISPLDALLVINALNSRGEGEASFPISAETDEASISYWDHWDLERTKRTWR